MNFAELRFWECLLGGLAVILGIRCVWGKAFPRSLAVFDKLALMVLGMGLLLAVSLETFVIYLVVLLVTYCGVGLIRRYHPRHASKYLWVLVPLQLAPLFVYKYADFALNRVLGWHLDWLHGAAIPVGISFYSFQLVGFVVDTLVLHKPIPRFIDCLNFAGFFPQVVAGPIERREDLLPQMQGFRLRWLPASIDAGAGWIVLGLFLKACLADNLAVYFNRGVSDNAYLIWLANVLFGLRIYCDFAGYSLVAYGIGMCFGIRLTLNFVSPYTARNAVDFWRRWHVTLSQWFRDYVYVPLGGGRVRLWACNVAVVFVVSGVWHGAGWNFMAWGALHACFLILTRLTGASSLPAFASWSLTMLATFFAWLFFYETDSSLLWLKVHALLSPAAYSLSHLKSALDAFAPGDRLVLGSFLGLAALTLFAEWLSLARHHSAYHYLRQRWVQVSLVLLTVLLAPGKHNAFIYFAF